ncbi:TetR/AcrR family transcriptional regulator [Amycolatopsis sp. WQ 127309]|uniref:TetR/AcrR family transcriptional regulator n=1 Tax=Amycolatopsis sp. WQ 127309 TaxID=2932773 RepID=UPI001FF19F21|nr:TetR/AcrR family transcriptional regulator [Amycolatopsis sp. WQ 127309]UOZ06387.1 TetR/AcrR family transcriptional regulator [Amycolatopsis sp. WQ 127309]
MVTPRQSAREQMMRDVVRVGREHLKTVLPADLSLRGVARDVGVVPSGLYRYVRDREALITLLIIDAYDELADEVDAAIEAASRRSHRKRLEAAVLAARAWAVREPSRFALLYGTPVLGYQAPGEQTVGPGTRVVAALGRLAEDAWRTGKLRKVDATLSQPVRADMERLRQQHGLDMPASNVARVYGLWSAVTGAILFDAFGQYAADTVSDKEAFLRDHVAGLADTIGL